MRPPAPPGHGALRRADRRRGGLLHRLHQERKGHPGGRYRHRGRPPRGGAPARLPPRPGHGVLRHLHRGRLQVPRPAGRPGEAPAQRRLPLLRARVLRRPGLRLPLRLFGHAPHGDHPGAAGAGVRSGSHHHPALGDLPYHQDRWHRGHGGQSPQLPRSGGDRAGRGALRQGVHCLAARLCGQHHAHVPGAPGRVQGHAVFGHQPGGAALLHASGRDHLRLFRHPQGPHQGLRLPGLRAGQVRALRAGEGGYVAQRRSGGRPVLHRPPGEGLPPRPAAV